MTERGRQLRTTIDKQITELSGLIQTLDEATLHLPCAGREKLGNGTVGACAEHTADNYGRIGAFVAASDRMPSDHGADRRGRNWISRFLRASGHKAAGHSQNGPDSHRRDEPYTGEDISPTELVEQLSAAREDLSRIAELTDVQLDSVPPKDSFRFCDGQRTLEQVLTGLIKHQDHQLRAIKAAIS